MFGRASSGRYSWDFEERRWSAPSAQPAGRESFGPLQLRPFQLCQWPHGCRCHGLRHWSSPLCNSMGTETRHSSFKSGMLCDFCVFSNDFRDLNPNWLWHSMKLWTSVRNSSAIFLSIKFAHRWSSPGALKAPLCKSLKNKCKEDISVDWFFD